MKFSILLFSLFLSTRLLAQSEITWTGSFDKANGKALIQAKFAEGWHVYSMHVDEMSGPVSTKIELLENPSVKMESPVVEPQPIESYDANFEATLQYFEKSVTFEQKLSVLEPTELKYLVTYMICNDVMCYPPVDEVVQIGILK